MAAMSEETSDVGFTVGQSRALVLVETSAARGVARRFPFRGPRPDAGFVAHLIATSVHAPQTRLRRQASAQDAVTRYRKVFCGDSTASDRGERTSLMA